MQQQKIETIDTKIDLIDITEELDNKPSNYPTTHSQNVRAFKIETSNADPLEQLLWQGRKIWIYTPPSYDGTKKFPVAYAHDGQNLFDSKSAFFGQEWALDKTLNRIGLDIIVVGIENSGSKKDKPKSKYREREYRHLNDPLIAKIISSNKFSTNPIVETCLREEFNVEFNIMAFRHCGKMSHYLIPSKVDPKAEKVIKIEIEKFEKKYAKAFGKPINCFYYPGMDEGLLWRTLFDQIDSVEATNLFTALKIADIKNVRKDWAQQSHTARSTEYVDFIANKLKPHIDSRYCTLPDRNNTGVFGSSYGGLSSLYLGLRHQDKFSKILAISPSAYVELTLLAMYAQEEGFKHPMDIVLYRGEHEIHENEFTDYMINKSGTERTTHAYETLAAVKDGKITLILDPFGHHDEHSWANVIGPIIGLVYKGIQIKNSQLKVEQNHR